MGLVPLDNLVRIHQLKAEPRNDAEIGRMLRRARVRLADVAQTANSLETRFSCAYDAAHAAALAMLRWHGYRSENRVTVFQCLEHTLGWPPARWRLLDAAHRKRNLAEYEGHFDLGEGAVQDLAAAALSLVTEVEARTALPARTAP